VTSSIPRSVIVIGAGPAGLTAAYRLALQGHRVTLASQSAALGEHLRRESDPPLAILGCHHATWSLLRSLGVTSSSTTFHEASLEFLLPNGRLARYPASRLPTPFHQLMTIGRFPGLSWGERWKLLSWLEQLWEGSLQLATDLEHRTAQDWLESLGHSQSIIQTIWNPLAQWLTGNDLLSLSADAFVASAQPIFLSQAADNRICVPRQPWHRMFVQPVVDRLQQAGARLLMGTRATQFHFEHERITGVRLQDGKMLQADWYVTAMAHHQLTPLLPERWLTRYAYFQQIAELTTTPCTVIQVRTARSIRVPRHIMMGTGSFPWMACKPSESDTGLVAVLTMPPGQPIIDTQEQVSTLLRSLGLLQPDSQLTSFRQHEVTHAVLGLHPGTKARRPIQLSPIPNLLLAGAWTDTGWPAILESAIVSGERCAEIINGRKPG
jgi:uncharacterized protein with NAD-binding domain and iron-sulfur cluster